MELQSKGQGGNRLKTERKGWNQRQDPDDRSRLRGSKPSLSTRAAGRGRPLCVLHASAVPPFPVPHSGACGRVSVAAALRRSCAHGPSHRQPPTLELHRHKSVCWELCFSASSYRSFSETHRVIRRRSSPPVPMTQLQRLPQACLMDPLPSSLIPRLFQNKNQKINQRTRRIDSLLS